MTDLYKPISEERNHHSAKEPQHEPAASSNETGRTLLIGMLGGIVSAAGYLIYNRLPEEQKDKLNQQVRSVVESRVNEFRSRLNF